MVLQKREQGIIGHFLHTTPPPAGISANEHLMRQMEELLRTSVGSWDIKKNPKMEAKMEGQVVRIECGGDAAS